ncbi:MAG: metallophosphoesterase [Kiritimatiellae bacterium]|nr:metallophosphoesterase [Kiritimatiellia bacterium]
MPLKIAAIADSHYATVPPPHRERGAIADILLLRAVNRINRIIRPDLTVVLGDLIDGIEPPPVSEQLRTLKAIVDLLQSPVVLLPGNHDGDPAAFYSVFQRPPETLDIKGVRLLPFVDPEAPGWNGTRAAQDLQRMGAARNDHSGPIVTLQHMSLFPPGTHACPFNLTNAGEVIETMRRHRIRLAIGGHYHPGFDITGPDGIRFVGAPALCEPPFAVLEIDVDDARIGVRRHPLRLPRHPRLIDHHVHTQFAYCSENMNMARAAALAEEFGLAGIAFAEHSGQLYVDRQAYWGWRGDAFPGGIHYAGAVQDRLAEYVAAYRALNAGNTILGLEVDCTAGGEPVLRPEDRAPFDVLLGTVHALPELRADRPDLERAADQFLAMLDSFSRGPGIRALAHPFRVFRRHGGPPPRLFEPVVRLLRERNLAAEINFHHNQPPPDFFKLCLDAGVKVVLGSDSHNLAEIGEFAEHLALLRQCGFDGELKDILANVV